jgi:competence protein ComEC
MLIPSMGLAVGILLPVLMVGVVSMWLWPILAIVFALAGVLVQRPRYAFFAACCCIGGLAYILNMPTEIQLGHVRDMRGKVVKAYDYGTVQRPIVRTASGARIAVMVYDYPYQIEQGDSVRFSGVLLPAVEKPTVPDELTGEKFARNNRLSATCMPDDGTFQITAESNGIDRQLITLREYLVGKIVDSGLSTESATFLSAILLGNDQVDTDIREEFSRAGLSHILALSGTHVSVIALMIAFLLFPVELAGRQRMRMMLTMIALWGYALLTGMSPSVVRAVVMASMLLLSNVLQRQSNAFNALCCAAVLILLFDPMALLLPGFQLSFLAVAGLLMFLPIVKEWVVNHGWNRRRVVMTLVTAFSLPIIAVIATSPLSAYYFHRFPAWFLVANLPVALLLPILLCSGVLLLLLSVVGIKAAWLAYVIDHIYTWIHAIAEFTATLPGNAGDGNLYFSSRILIPFYLGLLLLWLAWNNRRKLYVALGGLSILFALALIPATSPDYPQAECFTFRDRKAVTYVVRFGKDVYLVTDIAKKHYPELLERGETRLRDYLGKRHASIVGITTDSLHLQSVDISGDVWLLDGARYFILRSNALQWTATPQAGDVIIVSLGFRGDIEDVIARYPGCRITLSPTLPPQRYRRYSRSLAHHR